MHRIIAGATGLIGTALVNQWLQEKIKVTVVGRTREKIFRSFGNRVTALTWQEVTTQKLSEAELLVNLSGAGIGDKRWTQARKDEIFKSRVHSTVHLAELLAPLGTGAPRWFNASAVGIYGLQKSVAKGLPERLDERVAIDWDHAPDFLSQIGREWEKATHASSECGVRVVNLRFGVVLAKQGGALPKMLQPFQFFMGGTIGSGQQPFSWVSLTDLCRAIDFLIQQINITGPVNIVSPGCITQRELANAIGKALHKPSRFPTPSFLLKLIFGEMAEELLLQGQNVYPERLLDLGFTFSHPTIEDALRDIL